MGLRDIANLIVTKVAEIIENEKKNIEKNRSAKEQYYSQSGENVLSAFFDTGSHGEFLSYKTIAKHSPENLLVANCYIPKADGGSTEIDIQAVKGLDNLLDLNCKDQDTLALVKYISDEDKFEKVLENQQILKTPIVRNGKLATVGYQPDVWKGWS